MVDLLGALPQQLYQSGKYFTKLATFCSNSAQSTREFVSMLTLTLQSNSLLLLYYCNCLRNCAVYDGTVITADDTDWNHCCERHSVGKRCLKASFLVCRLGRDLAHSVARLL